MEIDDEYGIYSEYLSVRRDHFFVNVSDFRQLSEDMQRNYTRLRIEYVVAKAYQELAGWFTERKQFNPPYWSDGVCFGWGQPYSRQEKQHLYRWMPTKQPSALNEIANVLTGGVLDIDAETDFCVQNDPQCEHTWEVMLQVLSIYECAAWDYEGVPFKQPPIFGKYDRRLRWFKECRDAIGADIMLTSLEAGVPIEHIVGDGLRRRKLGHQLLELSGSHSIFEYVMNFPKMAKN